MTTSTERFGEGLLHVIAERDRQLKKWGDQSRHSLELYLSILVEEVGELAQAILHERFGEGHGNGIWREEVIHVATVALAMFAEKP